MHVTPRPRRDGHSRRARRRCRRVGGAEPATRLERRGTSQADALAQPGRTDLQLQLDRVRVGGQVEDESGALAAHAKLPMTQDDLGDRTGDHAGVAVGPPALRTERAPEPRRQLVGRIERGTPQSQVPAAEGGVVPARRAGGKGRIFRAQREPARACIARDVTQRELGRRNRSGRLERADSHSLPEHTRAVAVLRLSVVAVPAGPDDDEVSRAGPGHRGASLSVGGVGVYLELGPDGCTVSAQMTSEDAGARAVLRATAKPGATPGHDEVAVLVRRDVRSILRAGRVGVHLELAAGARPGGVEALAEHPRAAAVLPAAAVEARAALPDDDEPSVGLRGHLRRGLHVGRVRVHLELAADRIAGRVETLAEDADATAVLPGLVVAGAALPDDHESAALN